ncbi:hormone [Mactra antiquata]
MPALNRLTCCSCIITKASQSAKCPNLTFVRFRKPVWVKKSPSRIYRVREPTPIDPIEAQKMMEWTRVYNTEVKSIRKKIHQHQETLDEIMKIEKFETPFDIVFENILARNNAWNEETSKQRLASMAILSEEDALRQEKMIQRDIREREEIHMAARKQVLEAQEMKDSYVTPDNIDDVIEELLNTRIDYDFSINHDGSTSIDQNDDENDDLNVDKTDNKTDS